MDEWSVCRLCLQSNDDTLKRFPEGAYNMVPYLNIFFELVGVTLREYPSFPALICSTCENQMVQAYKFREKCIETEDKLRNMLDERTGEMDTFEFITDAKQNTSLETKSVVQAEDNVNENQKLIEYCQRRYINFEKKFAPEKIEKLKKKTIQCKRCNGFYKGIDLFKFHKCFENPSESVKPKKTVPIAEQESEEAKAERRKRAQYEASKKIYKCDQCDETFNHVSTFQMHKDRHENYLRYACEYCDKRFISWIQRRTHTYKKHLKKFYCTCAHCGKGYYTTYSLKLHIERKHIVNTYQCELCGKTLITRKGLKNHRLTHNNTTKFTCEMCGKELKSHLTLKQHIKTHSGEKNYICPVCSRGFTCNFSLKTHVRKLHPDKVHLLPPDGTIANQKYLKKLAEEQENDSD